MQLPRKLFSARAFFEMPRAAPEDDSSYAIPDILVRAHEPFAALIAPRRSPLLTPFPSRPPRAIVQNFSKRLIVGVQIVGCVLIFLYAIALISYGFTVGVHYSLAGQRLAYIMISLGTVLALHSFLGIQAARYQVLGWVRLVCSHVCVFARVASLPDAGRLVEATLTHPPTHPPTCRATVHALLRTRHFDDAC